MRVHILLLHVEWMGFPWKSLEIRASTLGGLSLSNSIIEYKSNAWWCSYLNREKRRLEMILSIRYWLVSLAAETPGVSAASCPLWKRLERTFFIWVSPYTIRLRWLRWVVGGGNKSPDKWETPCYTPKQRVKFSGIQKRAGVLQFFFHDNSVL
jgi:hypothetical protein